MKLDLADLLSCFICIFNTMYYTSIIQDCFWVYHKVHLEPTYFLYTRDDVNEKLFFRMLHDSSCYLSSKLHKALSNLNQSSPRGFCWETKILLF